MRYDFKLDDLLSGAAGDNSDLLMQLLPSILPFVNLVAEMPAKQKVQFAAAIALPIVAVAEIALSEDNGINIKEISAAAHEFLTTAPDEETLAMAPFIALAIAAQVQAQLAKIKTGMTDPAVITQGIENAKAIYGSMGKDNYLALANATDTILPPKLQAVTSAVLSVLDTGKIKTDYAKFFDKATTTPTAKLLREYTANVKKFPIDTLSDAVVEIAMKAGNLKAFFNNVATNLTPQHVENVLSNVLPVAKDLLTNATEGRFELSDPQRGTELAGHVQSLLAVFENAAVDAGLVADTDIVAALETAYQPSPKKSGPAAGL
jgi:hypothetical protein